MTNENDHAAELQDYLLTEVYVPEFVEKCAEYGLTIADDETLLAAIETATKLQETETSNQQNVVKEARDRLCAALGQPSSSELQKQAQAQQAAAARARQTAAALRERLAAGARE